MCILCVHAPFLLPPSPTLPSPTLPSHTLISLLLFLFSQHTPHTLTDEEKVLEEVIRDTEQLTLEEEEEEEVDPIEEKGEEEKAGGGQGAEPGSPAALLEEFIARSGV